MSSWIVFGGEDQRQTHMASNNTRRALRNTTNIVVRNGPAPSQGANAPNRGQGKRRNVQRRARQQQRSQINVRVLPNQNQTRRRVPNRTRVNNRVVIQRINTTLGTVGSNGSGTIETELAVLLNPSTMKEATGSNNFGPLQIYASTYSLYQMRSMTLTLKPLVGASAVSGTVVRTSWNPTNNPTQVSWSSLGARKHSDITPGRVGKFHLTLRDLKGPKDGWYRTNTKGDPMLSFAGSLEIHTLGETMSTYQNAKYAGGLFLAELQSTWAFKDYSQQPGLINLVKGDDSRQASIQTDTDGKLLMTLPQSSRLARAAITQPSEIIWMVTDAVITAGAGAFPPPFSWLIRGGWWFLKRIAGAPVRNGEVTFEVYSSINDARAGVPCISTQAGANVQIGQVHFQQITPGNVGVSDDIPQTVSRRATPSAIYVVEGMKIKRGLMTSQYSPNYGEYYVRDDQTPDAGLGFEGKTVWTLNCMRVKPVTDLGDINPSDYTNTIGIYYRLNQRDVRVGLGYASATFRHAESPELSIHHVLFQSSITEHFNLYTENGSIRQVNIAVSSGDTNATYKVTGTYNTVRIDLVAGEWYVMTHLTKGPSSGQLRVGDAPIYSIPTETITDETVSFTTHIDDVVNGGYSSVGSTIKFIPFTTSTITTYTPTQGFNAVQVEDPSPREEYLDADEEVDDDDPTDDQLELLPGDDLDTPPMSRLVVRAEAQDVFDMLKRSFPERDARLAANQLFPSDEYTAFVAQYHDALVDGFSPRAARAIALGL